MLKEARARIKIDKLLEKAGWRLLPSSAAYISKALYEEYKKKYSFPKKGDVLLSASGTIGRRVIYDGKPAYFQDSNIVWIDNNEDKILIKFLYHIYGDIKWRTESSTIARLYNSNLGKTKIPIPPLDVQENITSEIESEQRAITECQTLIAKMEQKIATKIAEVWGDI